MTYLNCVAFALVYRLGRFPQEHDQHFTLNTIIRISTFIVMHK